MGKEVREPEVLHLIRYDGVQKFKSVRRAIRRGHISPLGVIYPKRPFNNRKRDTRPLELEKERIYEQLKYSRKAS